MVMKRKIVALLNQSEEISHPSNELHYGKGYIFTMPVTHENIASIAEKKTLLHKQHDLSFLKS